LLRIQVRSPVLRISMSLDDSSFGALDRGFEASAPVRQIVVGAQGRELADRVQILADRVVKF
jgi:hypothetical protein